MRLRKNETGEGVTFTDADAELAKASDALAHPVRIWIYRYIFQENMKRRQVRNKDLVEILGLSQATVSGHLAKLASGGLVETRSEGSSTYYTIKLGGLARYIEGLRKI